MIFFFFVLLLLIYNLISAGIMFYIYVNDAVECGLWVGSLHATAVLVCFVGMAILVQ